MARRIHRRRSALKICHVVAAGAGGTWVVEQLRTLRDEYGCDVTACLFSDAGSLVDALRAEGIPLLIWKPPRLGIAHLCTLPVKIVELARLFRRERFDVVHTHLFHSMMIGRVSAWLADVPVRLAMIAGPYHLEIPTLRWIDRSTCWMDTAVIASCEYTRRLYRRMGVPDRRLELIYYGPDERRFDPAETEVADLRGEYGWPADTPLVGMVAFFYRPDRRTGHAPPGLRGRDIKGHEYLIRAMPAILGEFPTARLLLIGAPLGDDGRKVVAELQDLVGRLGLQGRVVFTGFRSDVPACLRALDVAVQASLNENLGGTIEALLMECPLVATRVGGMIDSVVDGETGLLVEPASPDELSRAILQLLRDPERARHLGRVGRRRMLDRFTLGHTARDLSRLYARLLRQRDPRRRYRPWASAYRLLIVAAVSAYLALRFVMERLAASNPQVPSTDQQQLPKSDATLAMHPHQREHEP